jgi:hypothetical protein
MLYFLHPTGAIEACEDEDRAARIEARGFAQCTPAQYRAAWAAKNIAARQRIAVEDARAVRRLTYAERVRLGI